MNSRVAASSFLLILCIGTKVASQCLTTLDSGGPIATVRGKVEASMLWDPDGSGPLPQWLVVAGTSLIGGDQSTPVGLLVHDGVQWRGLDFDHPGTVYALTIFNGDLVIAGSFVLATPIGGIMNRIARWDGLNWRPLGAGPAGDVRALTVFNGDLVAAGGFASAGGNPANNIARWNGVVWSALGSGLGLANSRSVLALASFNGGLYAGGFFTIAGGAPAFGLARWNGTTWFPAGNPSSTVNRLAVRSGSSLANSFLFAAGNFVNIGGVPANRVAQLNGSTNVWGPMGPGLPGECEGLLVRATGLNRFEVVATVFLGGSAQRVWRWTGTTWVSLGNIGPSAPLQFATASAPQFFGGAYVAGLEINPPTPVISLDMPAVFRFEADWTPLLGMGIGEPVESLVFDGPDAIVGGAFPSIDGVTVNGIARRSGAGFTALGSGVEGGAAAVHALLRANNGDVFAAGDFATAGGNAASNVARWDGNSWSPLGTGLDGPVFALLLAQNGDLIAGGDFTIAGGLACNHVARWNGVGWSQLTSGMDGRVSALAELPSGDFVAGGSFLFAGGVACSRVARWNGSTWLPMSGGMDDVVKAFTRLPNGDLVAGGDFTQAGGNPRSRIALWNGSLWSPLGPGLSGPVTSLLTLANGEVLAGGGFSASPLDHLARWNGANWSGGFGVVGVDVLALAAAPNGEVLVGGDFHTIVVSGAAAGNLAILKTNCPALATPLPTPCVGPAGPVRLAADALPWVGSTFRSTARGLASTALVVALLGFSSPNLSLSLLDPAGLPNCNLSASTEVVLQVSPVAGVAGYQVAIPNTPVLAGLPLWHQFIQIEPGAAGRLLSLSSSNALALVLGTF